jgi:ribulose kinase
MRFISLFFFCVLKNVSKNYRKEEIVGIGFDATCSLVAMQPTDDQQPTPNNNQQQSWQPLTVSSTGNDEQNIILWMDHRAQEEAEAINATGHELLRHVGGKLSLEMQCPKLMWLKKNLFVSCWSKAGAFFDLPDFLTWKCTGSTTRYFLNRCLYCISWKMAEKKFRVMRDF